MLERSPRSRRRRSCSEAEVDDVAVQDDVVLALQSHLAVLAAYGHRAARDKRVVGDDLGADEAAGDVAVNLTGRELRRRVARYRPCAALVLADREEGNIAEQVVAGADHPVESGLGETKVGKKRLGVGGI